MNGVMDYIFNSLSSTDAALRCINKTLRFQYRTNRNVSMFMVAMTVYAVMETVERREQDKKIKKLSEEIEELKQSEGE